MARTHARLLTAIWQDEHFRSLSVPAQHMYFLALSQPGLSLCGVVSFTPRRWALLSRGATPKKVQQAVDELVRERFVVVDSDTEELFVRSFVKHDGVLKQPNLVVAMWKQFHTILSDAIRKAFIEGLPEGFHEPSPEPEGDGSRGRTRDTPLPSPESISSSSEEDEDVHLEARRRLRDREAKIGKVTNPRKWLEATMLSIVAERETAILARAATERERRRVESCSRCGGKVTIEQPDGTVLICTHQESA